MRILTTLALTLMLSGFVHAQETEDSRSVQNLRVQPFYFDALNFAEYESFGLEGRLDVYVHVPYDIVTFVKDEEFYVGGYDVTVLVMQTEGSKLVKEESWERRIELLTFERTNNPNFYDLTQHTLRLDPGSYLLEVLFEDKESQKEFRLSKNVEVRKFDANLLGISDLMLVRAVENMGAKKQISPQINPNVASLKDGFQLFYEVYNPFQLGSITIEYSIIRKGKEVITKETTQGIKKGLNTFLASINSSSLGVGSYALHVKMRRAGDSTESGVLANIERAFIVEWLTAGVPISIVDLEEAIDQLRYYAKSEELEYIRETEDEDVRRQRFEEFWERHNPAPGAKTNAAMVEYYNRVAFANQHFGHYLAGWKTDRGMVYILYGPADYIDRHPVDVESKPYEIWEYYDLNKRFVFMDESGFGDYRLLYPLWDDRNRLR
jgi:GWxTD domain-containing protein